MVLWFPNESDAINPKGDMIIFDVRVGLVFDDGGYTAPPDGVGLDAQSSGQAESGEFIAISSLTTGWVLAVHPRVGTTWSRLGSQWLGSHARLLGGSE